MNKKISLLLTVIFSLMITFSVISCGGGGGSSSGQGGPEITPDSIEVSDAPAADTTEQEVAAPDEDTASSLPDQNLEGTGDTGVPQDSGLDNLLGSEESQDSDGTGTGDTDSDTTEVTLDTDTEGSETGDSGSDTSEITLDTDTEGTGPESDLDDSDPASLTGGASYTIDTSQGRWFQEQRKELFSAEKAKALNAQIKQLRDDIKKIRADYRSGLINRDSAKAQITALRGKISGLRAEIGSGGRIQSGIYTNWGNENLILNIDNSEPGWYRVTIVAKARETLPANYDRFSFNIEDSASGEILSAVSVKASDKVYFSGSAVIKLDNPGKKSLNILWTNDAYSEGEFNAALNIKKIIVRKVKEPKVNNVTNVRFNGDEYTSMEGRWFFDKSDAYTYWANQTIGYTFRNLEKGSYEITIQATNHGDLDLPRNYDSFIVAVESLRRGSYYSSTEIEIPAHNKGWKLGKGTLDLPGGDVTLNLTWLNDVWQEGEFDTNIKIKSIHIKKINPSNLTAYLLKTKPGNRLFVLAAFLTVAGLLFGIYVKNRTRTA